MESLFVLKKNGEEIMSLMFFYFFILFHDIFFISVYLKINILRISI